WRLRAGAAPPCIRPAAPVASDSAPEQTAMLRDVAAIDRPTRIAALGWTDFAADVAACEACSLCKTPNRTVPGVGQPRAEWILVGEAPGAEEDAKGEPFVGQAGRLLDNM